MRKKIFQMAICLLAVTSNSFAQQWLGSQTSTGSIYRDGSIGLGNTTPFKKITIKTSELGDGVWVTSNSTSQIAMLSNLGQSYWNGLTQSGDNMILWAGSNINQADAGALVIGPWTSANAGLRILPSGNVGIGTATPGSFKLAVEGKIGAREVRVTNTNPWPDYVFSPRYDLLPLKQVDAYIQQNGHLPDVPTEKEIHKDGYDLSKMDATLLKKIEELTLHMIELNKKMEQLTEENKRLQSKVK